MNGGREVVNVLYIEMALFKSEVTRNLEEPLDCFWILKSLKISYVCVRNLTPML